MAAAQPTPRSQNIIVILLAIVSLLTTALVVLTIIARRNAPAIHGEVLSNGASAEGVWYDLPEFALTDQHGQPFTLDRLKGKISIVDFIFTRCQGPCPMMTSRMAKLQIDLSKTPQWDQLQLVSISVDPEHDTPTVLTQYAGWSHADPGKWLFLTGTRDAVWQLTRDGFKLPVGEANDDPKMPIFHSQKFVLVDAHGRIRGMYDGLEPQGYEALLANLHKLLNEN